MFILRANSNNQSKIETIHASIDPNATEEERKEIINQVEAAKKNRKRI